MSDSVSFDEWLVKEAKREGLNVAIVFIDSSFGDRCRFVSDKFKWIDEQKNKVKHEG